MDISRIVTGFLPDGTSGIVENGAAPEVAPAALAGLTFFPLWATEAGASLDRGTPTAYWPGPDGTRFLVVRWDPPADVVSPPDSADDVHALAEQALPGLMGAFEPDNPGFHTSASIDYGVCLDGEMWLVLDDGHEARITPGTVVVQRGTRHAWQNRSDRPATMLYVLIGADPSRL